jgi:ATP:ADP antiporter, AAA family
LTAAAIESALARVVQVRREEIAALGWSFLYFFCLLAAYYVIRPVRDEMGVQIGVAGLQWLFSIVVATMVVLIPVFGWLAARLPVSWLLPVVYAFFTVNLLGFYIGLESGIPLHTLAPVFFVWVSVFNLFVVSVFWSFMADFYSTEAARRLFGFIAAGGSLGAIAGPGLTAILAPAIGVANLLLVSAALLSGAVVCIVALLRIGRRAGAQRWFLRTGEKQPRARPSLWVGLLRTARSPYLLGICAFLICYTLLSTMLYFMQTQLAPEVIPTPERRTQLFAAADFAVNALSLGLQLLATGRLLSRLGVTIMLAALPVVSVIGFFVLGVATLLPVLLTVGVLRRAGEFAISKPARETLFTVVPPEEKYQAKNVIDTVVYRGGDAASGWVAGAMLGAGLSLSGLAFIGVPVACLWLAIGVFLGRRHEAIRAATAVER